MILCTGPTDTQVMCRSCGIHLGGPIAGDSVRWETCRRCEIDPHWDLPLWRWLKAKWRRRREALEAVP